MNKKVSEYIENLKEELNKSKNKNINIIQFNNMKIEFEKAIFPIRKVTSTDSMSSARINISKNMLEKEL